MLDALEPVVRWCARAAAAAGLIALVVGMLSLAAPRRSIALYQWIMERFNWRVAPIDEAREIRTTRYLGALLVALSVVVLARLRSQCW